jgi:50S ribosomal protein L16 3-hydroxylase
MLASWLGPMRIEDFVATHVGRQAWASPGVAVDACALFDWATLDRLLGIPGIDLLVVAKGLLCDVPPPRALGEARALLQQGLGFVIRHAERHDAALASLAQALAKDLGGKARVQLFVTPAGTHGFGWHYDLEEVFIAQTAGIKDYYFRRNTVACKPAVRERFDFELVRQERSPVQTSRLLAGDLLYIPSPWWHLARCSEASLSISVGVLRR